MSSFYLKFIFIYRVEKVENIEYRCLYFELRQLFISSVCLSCLDIVKCKCHDLVGRLGGHHGGRVGGVVVGGVLHHRPSHDVQALQGPEVAE